MYVLALTCETSSELRIFFILKFIIAVILIGIPVITTISTMWFLAKQMMTNEVTKENIWIVVKKIFACVLVFLIIPIHNSVVKALGENSLEENSCWINATSENIESLRAQELSAREAKRIAEKLAKEEKYRQWQAEVEELKKQAAENQLKIESEPDDSGVDNNYDGSSENGKWGLLTVKNGVFILPNRRAKNNSETPVQEGKYGLNPIFWNRLSSLINDAAKRGCKVTVSSGHRSYSSQLSTWNNNHRACPTRCSWVAYPGGSRHNFGIAADLRHNGTSCSEGPYDCNSCAKWVHDNASKYGLKFRLDNEPWHIEPSQVQGGNFTSCSSICKPKI